MWRFFRAWCVCRISRRLPLAVWGVGGIVETLACCPGCGERWVGLRHVLEDCTDTERQREGLPRKTKGAEEEWSLQSERDLTALRQKVRFVGACVAQLVHKITAGGLGVKTAGAEGSEAQGRVARRPLEARGSRLGDCAPDGRAALPRPRRADNL